MATIWNRPKRRPPLAEEAPSSGSDLRFDLLIGYIGHTYRHTGHGLSDSTAHHYYSVEPLTLLFATAHLARFGRCQRRPCLIDDRRSLFLH